MNQRLCPDLQKLWDDYIEAEELHIRPEIESRLKRFIENIVCKPLPEWQNWAMDIAKSVVDYEANIKIRLPLFRSVIFPSLHKGIVENKPGCARWLADLVPQLHHSPCCKEQLGGDTTRIGILRLALKQDKDDARARKKLISDLQKNLEYSIHELPTAVLINGQCARNSSDCEKLLSELNEFTRLAEIGGLDKNQQKLVEKCKFHFNAFRAFLSANDHYDGYKSYLAAVHPHKTIR